MSKKYKQKDSNIKKLEQYIIKLSKENGKLQNINLNGISK
jgi:hypothetical protein